MSKRPKVITKTHKANFETLMRAARGGHLAMLDCLDTQLDRGVPVLVAMNHCRDGLVEFVPLAVMLGDDPYDDPYKRYCPPDPDSNGYAPYPEG